ncbi:MAG: ABC transporter ATP-binding protein, partial [Candidatus Korarchaeota archaeon]|nr:ABC transporter ATP-binding protein [Candidatus Korarchaeota archaeon]NIU85361.1 ATP-binding cassette domain-containing protein [Candidatus Thorarchaeota archaeon]NIW15459.1 ATP-binding cassette domain-containing protein [Candidatus Thorarchaeota archaeon]NIW53403.1 ATP-binding cassette domain-containing protein [Candidatus Korarchaeota archaeon]
MTKKYVIETQNLTKNYNGLVAVDHVDLQVKNGEIFGYLGPNGAGKTTTIKMLLGLRKPTAGSILINGKSFSSHSVELRDTIGYLPERLAFYDYLTPVETLNFFCELKGADKSIVRTLLREIGLEKAADRKVGKFSSGMVQLLGIAQAMIGNP